MGITGTESSNSKNLKHSAISYQLMRYANATATAISQRPVATLREQFMSIAHATATAFE
ncbi:MULTISPECIES: hypothetical protein [unclassified Moorena]|uniref:hypothetical protein n=1 Tax=unclassified Moorena TaxID=2683338 RepID=UPI0013C6A364|nr:MULTISPECIES: hypothetical protein [unclassified Moorena]NEO22272.1 hypothetical protein [Moorena sp. SIO4A5]NEQ58796.1 hypothetical protein [Moorena sp. SIO4A1]